MGGDLWEHVYIYDTKTDTYTKIPDMRRETGPHYHFHISCTAIKNQEGQNVIIFLYRDE